MIWLSVSPKKFQQRYRIIIATEFEYEDILHSILVIQMVNTKRLQKIKNFDLNKITNIKTE